MGEQRRRWSADHRWQHPGGFCTRAGAAAVRDPGARSMEDARAAWDNRPMPMGFVIMPASDSAKNANYAAIMLA